LVINSPISLLRRLKDAWETVLPTNHATKKTGIEKMVNVSLSAKMLVENERRGFIRFG